MNIFLVIDSTENLDKKIEILKSNFSGAEFKIFLNEQFAPLKNKKAYKTNLYAIYSNDLQQQMHKCATEHENDSVLIYYASAQITDEIITEMKKQIIQGSKCVFFKAKTSKFKSILHKIYNGIMKLILGVKDKLASVKIQYLDAANLQMLKQIGLKFRVLDGYEGATSEVLYDYPMADSLKIKKKIYKNNYINLAMLIFFIITTTLLGVFLKMPFFVWVLLICVILSLMFMQILFAVKNIFDERIK